MLCSDSGEPREEVPKSSFLYAIQDDPDRARVDRLMRFRTKKAKKDFEVVWEDDGSNIYQPNGLKRGQFVVLKTDELGLICGQVIKFQYSNKTSNTTRRYTYSSMIFGTNEGVEVQLPPAFQINELFPQLNPLSFTNFIQTSKYLCHIRESSLNLVECNFSNIEDYDLIIFMSLDK